MMSPNEFRRPRSPKASKQSASRLGVRLFIALVVMAFGYIASQQGNQRPAEVEKPPVNKPGVDRQTDTKPIELDLSKDAQPDVEESKDPTQIAEVTIRNLDGRVVFRGSVDLAPTLKRIAADERLSFPNDGSVFQNRERRLPKQKSGYYQEWVHPTPKLSGPGPQRVITGDGGEVYYTPDHYETFQRIK